MSIQLLNILTSNDFGEINSQGLAGGLFLLASIDDDLTPLLVERSFRPLQDALILDSAFDFVDLDGVGRAHGAAHDNDKVDDKSAEDENEDLLLREDLGVQGSPVRLFLLRSRVAAYMAIEPLSQDPRPLLLS